MRIVQIIVAFNTNTKLLNFTKKLETASGKYTINMVTCSFFQFPGRFKRKSVGCLWWKTLTLWILTTHICVENIVLAFMVCFLFNLSYNVMIKCEWHQLVYFAIITPSKPTTPPDFRCISRFAWQQSPKCQFCGQRTTPKITLIYRQCFIQMFVQKWKFYIHSKPQGQTLLSDWKFSSQCFSGYTSSILWDPVLRISSCLVHARKEFWVIQRQREHRILPLSIS